MGRARPFTVSVIAQRAHETRPDTSDSGSGQQQVTQREKLQVRRPLQRPASNSARDQPTALPRRAPNGPDVSN